MFKMKKKLVDERIVKEKKDGIYITNNIGFGSGI